MTSMSSSPFRASSGSACHRTGSGSIAVVQTLSDDRKSHRTALWQVDPHGRDAPRRLTRSAAGEGRPAFRPDGSLLFTSARPDPEDADGSEDKTVRLWLLPAGGGEPSVLVDRPGGIEDYAVAREAGTVVFAASELPGDDPERADRRKAAGVTATLHESLPIRDWDRQLGPAERRLFAVPDDGGTPRDLTPEPGQSLTGQEFAITPDGATVVTGWWRPEPRGERRSELVAIDTATGERRVLAAAEGADFHTPVIAPDGRSVVCVRDRHATYDEPHEATLWLVPLDGGEGRDLMPDLDRWPAGQAWSADSRTVYFGALDHGRHPRVPRRRRHRRGRAADRRRRRVRIPAAGPGRAAGVRPAVGRRHAARARTSRRDGALRLFDPPELPGRVTEVETTVDGERIRGWLVLPAEAEAPAPLVLWPHGGPHASWAGWHWRWNPWVMAARGYAVLLPDPALSLGYGQDFVRRGHGAWGPPAYADLMAITDATVARDDIDASRTAAMGGSYGGYMVNWIAGHTDRFQAIVTHASAWPLDAMITSDEAHYFIREFGDPAERPERWTANDPAPYVGAIRTPMLVIHGDRDYRVPMGHALRLWSDLVRHEVEAKFLYFPDENHWILSPGNVKIWYETILAFLDHHVRGEKWQRPDLL